MTKFSQNNELTDAETLQIWGLLRPMIITCKLFSTLDTFHVTHSQ